MLSKTQYVEIKLREETYSEGVWGGLLEGKGRPWTRLVSKGLYTMHRGVG